MMEITGWNTWWEVVMQWEVWVPWVISVGLAAIIVGRIGYALGRRKGHRDEDVYKASEPKE
jgi:hypothetical protein